MNISKLTLTDGSIPFDQRMKSIKDKRAIVKINARIMRLADGNAGDHKQLAEQLWELRIDVGEGWRVYYSIRNHEIVLLMLVGNKSTQVNDIAQAKEWLDELN